MGSHSGGCQLALHGDKLFLYSGHTVVVDKADKTETDLVHDDLWSLDLGTFTVRYPPMQQCSMLRIPAGVTACMQAARAASSELAHVSETFTHASLLRCCHIWQSASTRQRDSTHQERPRRSHLPLGCSLSA